VARNLDEVVTAVATELMAVNAATSAAVSQRVLGQLVGHFGVDFSFLRHNDHDIHATILIAEWPLRPEIPDPDPIGTVYFADADPVFAAAETAKEILVFRPEPATDEYQKTIEAATNIPGVTMAVVPMLSGDVTTGCLGFVKIGNRDWMPKELNALKAIASLFAQLQARIVAEDQLRFLAEHDDLTGLNNRRALIAHLDRRLAPGQ
jgi:GAF domain-containing protein